MVTLKKMQAEDAECPICRAVGFPIDILVLPPRCQCLVARNICLHCFRDLCGLNGRHMCDHRYLQCPSCRRDFQVTRDEITRDKIPSHRLYVKNYAKARDYDSMFGPMECPRCEAKVNRNELDDHFAVCPGAYNHCRKCGKTGTYSRKQHETTECPEGLAECSGCHVTMARRCLEQHMSECPEVIITCLDCRDTYLRKNALRHTCRVARTLQILLTENSELRGKMLIMEEEHEELRSRMCELESFVERLRSALRN